VHRQTFSPNWELHRTAPVVHDAPLSPGHFGLARLKAKQSKVKLGEGRILYAIRYSDNKMRALN